MLTSFIFFVLLVFINLILAFRQIPVIAFPIGLFSFYIGATLFLTDTDIPQNPHATLFFMIIITCSLLANALSLKEQ